MSVSPIKTVFESFIDIDGENITYSVVGKGFLKQMVRIIVGTLVDLSRCKNSSKSILDIIAARDRTAAGMTAPAQGLYLESVQYQDWNSALSIREQTKFSS